MLVRVHSKCLTGDVFHSARCDCGPQLDAAMERGATATTEDQQKAAWREVTEIIQQEQPVTFMFWLNELAASRSSVSGVEMDPRGEFRSIAQWTVSR